MAESTDTNCNFFMPFAHRDQPAGRSKVVQRQVSKGKACDIDAIYGKELFHLYNAWEIPTYNPNDFRIFNNQNYNPVLIADSMVGLGTVFWGARVKIPYKVVKETVTNYLDIHVGINKSIVRPPNEGIPTTIRPSLLRATDPATLGIRRVLLDHRCPLEEILHVLSPYGIYAVSLMSMRHIARVKQNCYKYRFLRRL